ncbi:MAG: hypothetical protein DCF24_12290 [Cyanobium sp.]|nr:MAG: hypothetical protein DCF24_12290 [Cyanobium sp.]PZV02383.1 MAG: hypothetical protein DCF23_11750 [Cyanobium sp.]
MDKERELGFCEMIDVHLLGTLKYFDLGNGSAVLATEAVLHQGPKQPRASRSYTLIRPAGASLCWEQRS